MGVDGLTKLVGKLNVLDIVSRNPESKANIIVVFDGMALIYWLWEPDMSVDTGGCFVLIEERIREVVQSFRNCKMEPVFIFDGATPASKFETCRYN
jgi:hypothetical protein